VVNGLAWTPVGGEVLHIEATKMPGKGGLSLTGQLGDVMKESVQAALAYIRAHGDEFYVGAEVFQENEIHVHVPAGAVPKDGPSAGCAMATALISVLTQVPVRKDVAMTGEMTLRGKVLPIGGLKEKILAAVRAGIKTVLIPEQNKKDLEDIPKEIQKRIKIIAVREIDEVLKLALEKYPLTAPKKQKPGTPKVVVRPAKELSA
jgi:ATP-dependent Lon protease